MMVEKILNDILKTISYSYAKRTLFVIKQIFKNAKRLGYVKDDSFLGYVVLNRPPKTIAQLNKEKFKFLNKDELEYVLAELNKLHKNVALVCEFLSLTGLRIGELEALEYDEYNKEAATITVRGTFYRGKKTTPKNEFSHRTVSLNKRAVDIVDYFIKNHKTTKNNFIFNNVRMHHVNYYLRQIDFKVRLSTHIFRHTHISLLSSLNVPIRAIMERVGHNDPKTTISIYTHVTAQMDSDLRQKLELL